MARPLIPVDRHVMVCAEPQVATPYRGHPVRCDPPTMGGRRIVPMAHRFEITKDVEVGATPEEVWEAIATGPGMDSWFMGQSEVEPREGGRARWRIGASADGSSTEAGSSPA